MNDLPPLSREDLDTVLRTIDRQMTMLDRRDTEYYEKNKQLLIDMAWDAIKRHYHDNYPINI